jgi:hypothetical protein
MHNFGPSYKPSKIVLTYSYVRYYVEFLALAAYQIYLKLGF